MSDCVFVCQTLAQTLLQFKPHTTSTLINKEGRQLLEPKEKHY